MITQRYFERHGKTVLYRLAVSQTAVFDIVTTDEDLDHCRRLLPSVASGPSQTVRMGSFGLFEVTLTVSRDDGATIMIEGPDLETSVLGVSSGRSLSKCKRSARRVGRIC